MRIVLAFADFSKELTTSVLWLNDYELNVLCVRMRPYGKDGNDFLDIQHISLTGCPFGTRYNEIGGSRMSGRLTVAIPKAVRQ